MSRRIVDVLILRTVKCDQDSRVSKMLHHYTKIGVKVGIVCISRGETCKRVDTSLISHLTLHSGMNSDFLSRSKFLRRIVLRLQLLKFLFCSRRFNPTVLHGCDLDGYLAAKYAFNKKKIIFEVYDPWTTMTASKRAAKLEAKAFVECSVLIMPAKDSRIKVEREHQISFGNVLDASLLKSLLMSSALNPNVENLIAGDTRFILSGGILGKEVATDKLITFIAKNNLGFKLLVTSESSAGFELDPYLDLSNVHFIGKQTWGDWLTLVQKCSALWVYYDAREDHFRSHISPNKYWEASILNVPMLVNSISQFCDRTPLESPFFELGSAPEERLSEALHFVEEQQSNKQLFSNVQNWEEIEYERTLDIKQVLSWVGLGDRF